MEKSDFCPNCGLELKSYAPEGICPACLPKAGFPRNSVTGAGTAFQPTSAASQAFIPPTPAELSPRFPQLEILELLGKGGMGAVYKARQRELGRLVAVKILPPEVAADPHFSQRFAREARTLATLSHQNIVSIFDFGQVDGLFYFVMEYVDGPNLRHLMRTSVLPDVALAIVPQICEALQFAHQAGAVHRDIKPENILIDKQNRVKIADFGLVKLLGGNTDDSRLTGSRQAMGTPNYMAPEQMLEPEKVDNRADIYSLGVVFYEMLTCELPIGRFAPPTEKVQLDNRLDEVVFRALENEPENRYQQASEVSVDIASISGSHLPASIDKAPSASESSKSMSGDNNSLFWIATFAVIATSVVLPAFLGTHREPLITFVQWAFSSGSILFAGLGILQILAPGRFWFFSRYVVRGAGVSTTEDPESGALLVIRIRGVLMLAFAIAAPVFVQILLSQFIEG